MSQITIADERLRAEFRNSTDPSTVHDSDGRILGFFTPLDPSALRPRVSEAELSRREEDRNAKLYTTDEVIAKLRSL